MAKIYGSSRQLQELAEEETVSGRFSNGFSFFLIPLLTIAVLFGVILSIAWVPSGSMEPTLPTKSNFIGLRLPYLIGDPCPQRGDIVMFYSDELEQLLVKRVIGLPGETVSLENGKVYINGELLDEPYLSDDIQTFPSGENRTTFIVRQDHFLPMGDNRGSSFDSRAWKEPDIPLRNIRAKALIDIAVLPECTWRGIRYVGRAA